MLSNLPFPPGIPADAFLHHAERLNGEALPRVVNQHVVSKVLLRRFAGKDRNGGDELVAFALAHGRARLRGLKGCGTFPLLVPVGSGTIEARWKVTEDRLHDAFDGVTAGTLFADPAAQSVIRDAVALHFSRSIHTLRGHHQALHRTWLEQRRMAIRELSRPLARYFYRMTGIHPRGNGALEIAFDDVATKGIEVLTEGWPFRTRIEDLFGRVRAWLAPCSVQILRSAEPLLISDAPAVATAAGRTRAGTGVGLLHADEIILPLAPGVRRG